MHCIFQSENVIWCSKQFDIFGKLTFLIVNLWFQGVENFGLEKIMDLWVLMQPEDKRKKGESL